MTGVHAPIPQHAHPLVRELFSLVRRRGVTLRSVARKAGLHEDVFTTWRRKSSPNIVNLEAALNALGHELVVQRRQPMRRM